MVWPHPRSPRRLHSKTTNCSKEREAPKRDEHYTEAEHLLNGVSWIDDDTVASDSMASVLAALTHAVLASVDSSVADPLPW